MKQISRMIATASIAALACTGFSTAALALDVDAAKDLVEQNNCKQCHALRKDKDGPSFMKTAEKYKGKPNAVDEIVKHLTSGKKVKLADGSEENHKIVKTMPPNDMAQIKNLAEYVLSIQPK
ncbi:c-type cytochrome [Sulfuricystis multivorans]|uniref:c-type cytochrome n=1 Tax=Sulfuricystis multivorans TaxID=2211108 RepID=UPI000F837DBB|nr:c-type cytochrome [Sulfuricystis multivorans]